MDEIGDDPDTASVFRAPPSSLHSLSLFPLPGASKLADDQNSLYMVLDVCAAPSYLLLFLFSCAGSFRAFAFETSTCRPLTRARLLLYLVVCLWARGRLTRPYQ